MSKVTNMTVAEAAPGLFLRRIWQLFNHVFAPCDTHDGHTWYLAEHTKKKKKKKKKKKSAEFSRKFVVQLTYRIRLFKLRSFVAAT